MDLEKSSYFKLMTEVTVAKSQKHSDTDYAPAPRVGHTHHQA